jgi:hypothetical protein
MKYDDASWHYGGEFPKDLPPEAGATHIALFLAWAASANLLGELHSDENPALLAKLRNRSVTPVTWFVAACDEKFTDEDLNAEGNAFAAGYYADRGTQRAPSPVYLSDYSAIFAETDHIYKVPDDWKSYDRLKPLLDKRFADWKSPKPRGWRRIFK